MLIDINLLPEKEKKRFPLLFLLLFLLIVALAGASAFLLTQSQKKEIELLDSQLKTAGQLRATLEAHVNQPDSATDKANMLNQAIRWAEENHIETVPMLNHLIERLPDRGYFDDLAYINKEALNLKVKFDSGRQAAYYLSELQASEWIESANMTQLDTSVEEGETEAKELIEKNNALPRYVASYEIVFNMPVLKEESAEQKEENP